MIQPGPASARYAVRTNLSMRRETTVPERPDRAEPKDPYVCPVQYAGLLTGWLRRLMNHPKRILRPVVAAGDTVVDLGCGPGFFTLPLAELVGAEGHVIAVDVQQGMLDMMRARAEAAGLSSRIQSLLVTPDGPVSAGPADMALAFWVLHETPDRRRFLQNAHDLLKPGGRLLLVEPIGHVSKKSWAAALATAQDIGFTIDGRPRAGFSRAALLHRASR
jgi:SAM-dependent methyltransferase